MTKREQIEEMARIMCRDTSNRGDCEKCDFKRQEVFGFIHQCFKYDNAEAIYNAGYRKIDDKCTLITKDDLNLYKKQDVKEFAEKLKERLCEECSGCYIPNCFETPTDEFAYNAKEVEKIIDELLK